MASLEQLHEILDAAASKLNEAAYEIRDIPLEPKQPNIRRIGEILVQIFELQREIYRLRPELIPTILWQAREPDSDPGPEQVIRGAFRRAELAEAADDPGTAIQFLEFLVQTQPIGDHVARARSEMERLRAKGHDT